MTDATMMRAVWRARGKDVRRLARWLRVRGTSRVRIGIVRERVCERIAEHVIR